MKVGALCVKKKVCFLTHPRYLYDCREALLTRLYDVDSKCSQVDKTLEHYRKFDLMASKRLEEKIKAIIG